MYTKAEYVAVMVISQRITLETVRKVPRNHKKSIGIERNCYIFANL